MKQLMTLERHTNVVNTPSKKSNFRNKKILSSEYVLKNQLGNSNSGKSEIDAIFENIKKLKVSKRANLKKGKAEEPLKVLKNIVSKNFQEAIAQAAAEPVSNCNINRSSNSGSTKSLHWAKTPGTSPERKDTEVVNFPSKVASDTLPSINQSSTMVSSVFPSNSIAEKKKLIWEKERAELQEFGFYNPWGKSGCGAPIKDQQGNIVTDYFKRKNDEEPLQQKSTFPPQHHEMVRNVSPNAEKNYNNSSNIIDHNNHSHSITAPMPTTATIASANDSQYKTSTNNMAQNGAHNRSYLLGMNAPIDEMRRREKEEKIRKDIEYLEDLKNQIEANKRAKEQELENQRRLDMEEEEAFCKHTRLLEQRESQQRQHLQLQQRHHRQQSFGQTPLNSQTHHYEFMPETGVNLTTITSANDSQYETSTNNMAQNGAHKRSNLLGMNVPIDEMRRREMEERRRKETEHLEDLKKQIEANKRAKEQELENRRRLEMEEEEAFRKHTRLLEQRESQQRHHRQQSFGQIPLNSQTHHHHQFMPETGANLTTPTPGKPQRGPMSAAELQQANYAAIEKARFEAERDKKVKKIRELAKWGHNISKLKADFEEKYGPLPTDIPTNFSNNNLDNSCIYNINNNSNSIYGPNDSHNNIESNGSVLGNNQENGHAGFVRSSYQDQSNLPTYHNYKNNLNNRCTRSKATAVDGDKLTQETYAAMEKASFEAKRDKKEKKRELAEGQFHDISKFIADNEVLENNQESSHAGFVRSSYSVQQRQQRSMQQQSPQDHRSPNQQLMQSLIKKENDIDEYVKNDNNNNYNNKNFLVAARESLRKRSEHCKCMVGNMQATKQGRSSSDRQYQQQLWQPQQQLQQQNQLERRNVDCMKINFTDDDDVDDEEEEGDGYLESAENLIPLVRTANVLEERTKAEDRRGVADRKQQGLKKHTLPKNPLVQRSLMTSKLGPKKKKSVK